MNFKRNLTILPNIGMHINIISTSKRSKLLYSHIWSLYVGDKM